MRSPTWLLESRVYSSKNLRSTVQKKTFTTQSALFCRANRAERCRLFGGEPDPLFENLVSTYKERRGDDQPKCGCGLTVYVEFENGGLLNGQVSRLRTFQNLVDIDCSTLEEHRSVGSVRKQTARFNKFLEAESCRQVPL